MYFLKLLPVQTSNRNLYFWLHKTKITVDKNRWKSGISLWQYFPLTWCLTGVSVRHSVDLKSVFNGWLLHNMAFIPSVKSSLYLVTISGVKVTPRRPVLWQSRSGRRCWTCSPKPTGPWPTWDQPNPPSPWRARWSRPCAGRTTLGWTTEE